ncbi:hypothetical protein SADUNF_Sadunf06G0022700 [Salix dunnii]|uniref:AAA+ ATPase domain-containing protein n=1 Tax=Salix dunnii TaxID=1413687 RepID=A0A835K219_9ROSI|nr:hypothetical protein SADUNF_Sadunf06G0022700 [Salix dunnii]
MPSKTKKNPKTPSRLSNSDQSASSPRTPSLASSIDLEASQQEDIALCLEEASSKYPSLIGTSAFIGRITDVEAESSTTARGCKIWLSESSMVSSSFTPGSIVSVSLAAAERSSSGSSSPLSSFSHEWTRQCEVESVDEINNVAGNYFALATVFPSSKVSKNGVRLSSNLAYTMGCPTSGKVIFVHAMRNKLLTDIVNGNDKSQGANTDDLSLHNCNEMYLELVPFMNRVKMKSDTMSAMKSSVENRQDRSENGTISSPKTPLCQPNRSSPSPIQLASPICEEAASNTSNSNGTDVGLLNIKEVLEDESAKKLLEVCATSWLYSRFLICGNLVAIPLLSNLCIFRVTSANKLPADGSDKDLMKGRTHGMQPQNSEELGHMKDAFSINRQTKVYLHRQMKSTTEGPQKQGLPLMQSECSDGKTIIGHDRSKLGGLHEEYAVLKDIIVSSMKNTLSSFGLRTTKGVLLHGPPGTGKTSLARLCVVDAGANLFSVNGPEIISQNYGESEQAMHKFFDSACQSAPAVRYVRSKKSDYSAHPKGSSVAYEDHSDSMVKGSDCSTGARDMSRDSADSASSSTSHLPVSLENLSSSCLDGDVSEITDNIENGIFACPKEDFFMEEALLNIVSEDFEMARMKVRPSAMREVILEVPKVNWEDVGGQKEIKNQLMEAVLWPQTHQDAFKRIGLQQRVNVTVIAATNRPDKIDPALLRPGRFDRLLYVGPPNQNDREDIFHIHLRKVPCSSDVNVKKLACLTDGCTGADIALICREAAVAAIEENIDASEVSMQHLKMAIQQVQPMEINSYQDLSAKFQRLVRSSDKDELGNQECESRSNSFSVRTMIKSVAHILNRSSASSSG